MRYEGTVYRPPSEAGSPIFQATVGCPHNRCLFCATYSDKKFRKRPVEEVVEDLDMALETYGSEVRTIFLADGNSAALPTDHLVVIGDAARERFPHLERITMYASAKFLVAKSRDEWNRIGGAGITRIHSGLESGDPLHFGADSQGGGSGGRRPSLQPRHGGRHRAPRLPGDLFHLEISRSQKHKDLSNTEPGAITESLSSNLLGMG